MGWGGRPGKGRGADYGEGEGGGVKEWGGKGGGKGRRGKYLIPCVCRF